MKKKLYGTKVVCAANKNKVYKYLTFNCVIVADIGDQHSEFKLKIRITCGDIIRLEAFRFNIFQSAMLIN